MIIIWLVFGICLVMGLPLAVCFGLSSLVFMLKEGIDLKILIQRSVALTNSFTLMAVPLFILTGYTLNKSGITQKLVKLASCLVGSVIGGLGHVNIMASILFAGITGSAQADTAMMGSILIPAMEKAGFDKDYSAGVTVASSMIGPIIPPSIIMVIYAFATQTSVAGLFLAGFIPGLIFGLVLMVMNYVISKRRRYLVTERRATARELAQAVREALPGLIAPLIIVGGILSGFFTPTEAAGIAVAYALFLGFFVYRSLRITDLPKLLFDSALVTSVTMFMVAMTGPLSWNLAMVQIQAKTKAFLVSISPNPLIVASIALIMLVIMGFFLSQTAIILMMAPIFAPIMVNLGLHNLHWGFIFVLSSILGLATPPVGVCLFVASAVSDLSLEEVVRGVFPFILAEFALLFVFLLVPDIAMFLPKLFGFYY